VNLVAYNRTRNVLVAEDVEVARTAWQRIRGLIGRTGGEFRIGQGLWIEPAEGIHTFGMSFPIDAIYLDANGRVLKAYHGLRPARVAAIKWRARGVLELPAGVLVRTGTEVGDCLEIKPARYE
jgi:uncharacterized protein